MKGRSWGVLLVLGLLTLACGEREESSPAAPRPSAVGDLAAWPDVEPDKMSCVVVYPDDLAERDRAFAGQVESVEIGQYDEDAGARPARVAFRIEELFRGIVHGDYIVLNTWDFMLPERDITGAHVLAAGDNIGDLMGCGFTRPYSEGEAEKWRETFAALPPEDCGKEVRDCYLGGEASPVPADCSRASQEYAIATNIDQSSYPFTVLGCDRRYLALRVDLGADTCPPEATEEQRQDCARTKAAYFVKRSGAWKIITYESATRCRVIQEMEPDFPSRFCIR